MPYASVQMRFMVNKSAGSDLIRIEVAIALPDSQEIIELVVEKGCTASEALGRSGLRARFPDMNFDAFDLGIFSRPLNGIELPLPGDYVLEADDRVELYRPLAMDPKQARMDRQNRQKRAQKK